MWISRLGAEPGQVNGAEKTELAGAADSPPFDLPHLERMTYGDRALAREVLRLFDFQAEKYLAAITIGDAQLRFEAAHALKGAARGVGAFAVARTAEEIESADAAVFGEALAKLKASVAAARLVIPTLLRD